MKKLEELYIEILDKCNLKCRHCSSEACQENNTFMELKTYKILIRECMELGLKKVCISGGEPLLHPNLLDMIKFTKDNDLDVTVYSCGVNYINKVYCGFKEEVFEELKIAGAKNIIFSMHGLEQEHNHITDNEKSYKFLKETIENCKKANLEFEIHTVPMTINYAKIEDVIKEAKNIGAKRVSILRLVPQGRLKENLDLEMNEKQYKEFNKITKSIMKKYGEYLRIGHPLNVILNHCNTGCNAGENKILLDVYGNCYPCEAFKMALKGKTSNYFEKSIKDIWEDDYILNELRNKSLPEECGNCSERESCNGGCFGQRYLKYNDINKFKDPICSR